MGRPAWWIVMGAGGLAGCDPNLVDYCAPGAPECSRVDGGSMDAPTDAGDERGAETSGTTADGSCDPTKSPLDDPCVVVEAYGVFVSPTGSDANQGTRPAPVLTIGRGMDVAKAAGKRVYVCAGSYAEQLVVAASRDGVNVYGGLDCARWTYAAANKVVVAPARAGYALELDGLQAGVTFEDIEFDTQSANSGNPGESSIAVFARGSQKVALHRVTMVASSATDGSSGASGGPSPDGGTTTDPSNWFGTPPNYAELNGSNATDGGAAASRACTCRDASRSKGGQGGAANGPMPSAGEPLYGDAGPGAAGIDGNQCNSQGGGGSGGDAPVAAVDTPSTSLGACSASGWTPGVGAAGAGGKPGQGGGGGGNGRLSSGSGGGGACGGCGGAGG